MKRYKNLSRKGKIAVWAVAALVVIAIAGGNGGSKEQETAESKPTTTVEQTATTEKVTTTTKAPTATSTTTTVFVPESDWPSAYAYAQEIGADLEKVVEIGNLVSDGMELYIMGAASDAEIISLIETARTTLASYIDYYAGTVAPAGFEEAHALVQEAWELTDQSFAKTIEGIATGNVAVINEATALMKQSGDKYNEATASVKRTLGTA